MQDQLKVENGASLISSVLMHTRSTGSWLTSGRSVTLVTGAWAVRRLVFDWFDPMKLLM